MDVQTVRDIMAQELPDILRQDTRVQQTILGVARSQFANKIETESRFDRLLDELRRERETQHEKWKANQSRRFEGHPGGCPSRYRSST